VGGCKSIAAANILLSIFIRAPSYLLLDIS
jgi:hypothetical protein